MQCVCVCCGACGESVTLLTRCVCVAGGLPALVDEGGSAQGGPHSTKDSGITEPSSQLFTLHTYAFPLAVMSLL